MKIYKHLALGLLVISLTPVFAQSSGTVILTDTIGQTDKPPALTKFNLDFPGGTPSELVAAIEKATGKPLNAIIPDEDAKTQLPPLKMNDVYVPQLFQALQMASIKQVRYETGTFFNGGGRNSSYSTFSSGYGFKTEGKETDNSVWYFFEEKPPQSQSEPTKSCRFYQLAPYLDWGLTVDDITTAIQTGWKMMGDEATPEISFHKETKLLIAVGEPEKLEVIDNVLKALQPPPPDPAAMTRERLQQLRKNQPQISVPPASPLSPEALTVLEEVRKNSQHPSAILPPPPIKPEAGQ